MINLKIALYKPLNRTQNALHDINVTNVLNIIT